VLVADTQKTLQAVPVAKRYYDLFVNSVIEEKRVEGGEDVRSNRRYPPITLGDILADRQDALRVITSKSLKDTKRFKEVEGAYTEEGHYRVVRNVAEGVGLLEREQWVVPLGPEEKGDRVVRNLEHLAEEYDQRYAEQWTDWLLDITVQSPATVKEAIDLYNVLSKPERPYLRILRTLEDHTQWKRSPEVLDNQELQRAANEWLRMRMQATLGGIRVPIELGKTGDRLSNVPGLFRKTIEFALPTPGLAAEPPLNRYLSRLEELKGRLAREEDAHGPLDPRQVQQDMLDAALKESQELLLGVDDKGRTLLTPLLANPLRIVTVQLPAQGANAVPIRPAGRWRRP
jgi:type VI secretion system protein ImpL